MAIEIDPNELLQGGHMDVLKMMFEKKLLSSDSNLKFDEHFDIIKLMIEKKIIKNVPIDNLRINHFNIIKLMLQKKLIKDVNIRLNYEETLLMVAADRNCVESIELLLQQGANLDCQSHNGYTALINAALGGRLEIVKLLVEHGANLDLHTVNSLDTALILAVYYKYEEIAKILVNAGANSDMKDCNGRDALYYAKSRCSSEFVKLIEDSKLARAAKLNNPNGSIEKIYKDSTGKIYPSLAPKLILCHGVFMVGPNENVPCTVLKVIDQDICTIKTWKADTEIWVEETLTNANLHKIQVCTDTNNKLAYHSMALNGVDIYLKFPSDLKLADGSVLGEIYRD